MSKKENVDKIRISVLEILNNYTDSVIIFFDKDNNRNKKYYSFNLNCKDEYKKEIVRKTKENLDMLLKNKTIDNYDLEISIEDSIQKIESSKILNFEIIKSLLTTVTNITPNLNKDTKFSNLDFYAIHLYLKKDNNTKEIIIFRKHHSLNKTFEKSFKIFFDTEEIKVFDKELISIDCGIDAFIYDGNFYVINRNSFNVIFDFKDFYKKVIIDNQKLITESKLLTNSTNFINDCVENGTYLKRLTKFFILKDIENIKNHRDNIKNVINGFGLKINLNEENQIIYNDKKDAGEILNLFLEHYVVSALTDNKLIAKAIEKYND